MKLLKLSQIFTQVQRLLLLIRSAFGGLLDFLMPPRCVDCGDITESHDALCSKCWPKYRFIEAPLCEICGRPFEISIIESEICLGCIHKKPKYDIARSLFRFDESSKHIIHNFKYHDKTYLAKFFAKMLFAKYPDLINEADIITYVPMHKFKRLFRLYNQASVLANEIAKLSNKKLRHDIIAKIKSTPSQTLLSRAERKVNLRGSFGAVDKGVKNSSAKPLKGKIVLLIDDVITSGSTVNICAEELKKAGAKRVEVLSIAKNYA